MFTVSAFFSSTITIHMEVSLLTQTTTSSKLTKVLLSIVLGTTLITASPLPSTATTGGISISIDGQPQSFATPPMMIEDRVYVPIRALLEAFGYTVTYDAQRQQAEAIKGSNHYLFHFATQGVTYENPIDRGYRVDAKLKIVDGRSMISARFLSELLGMDVTWDSQTQTVWIDRSKVAIFEAILAGDLPSVRTLLENGTDPNSTKKDVSALDYAIHSGNPAIAKLLVENGVAFLEDESFNLSIWRDHIFDPELLRDLLLLSAGTEDIAERASKMLPDVVRNGSEGVHLLLALGAKPTHSAQSDGAISTAVVQQNTESIQALLLAGADPNVHRTKFTDHTGVERGGEPILIEAVSEGSLEITDMLLKHGANPNVQYHGRTPLMIAAEHGHVSLTTTLIGHGADLDLTNDLGVTALDIAKAHGNTETALVLEKAGAPGSTKAKPADHVVYNNKEWMKERTNKSPLEQMAMAGRTDQVKQLLTESKIDVYDVYNALYEAIYYQNLETIQTILANRQNLELTSDLWGRAIDTGNTQMLLMFGAHAKQMSDPLPKETLSYATAFRNNNVPVIRTLLELGFDADDTSYGGFSNALNGAAWSGFAEITKLLLEAGADPNRLDKLERNAVSLAVQYGNPATLNALLSSDKLTKATTGNALFEAVKRDSLGMVEALLKAGADPHFKTQAGRTPLQLAEEIGNEEMLTLLKSAPIEN